MPAAAVATRWVTRYQKASDTGILKAVAVATEVEWGNIAQGTEHACVLAICPQVWKAAGPLEPLSRAVLFAFWTGNWPVRPPGIYSNARKLIIILKMNRIRWQ